MWHAGPDQRALADYTFNGVSSVLAGLTFLAFLCTVLMQYEEIRRNKNEQAEQRLTDQFFQLLRAWQASVSQIQYAGEVGNEALLRAENEFLGVYRDGEFPERGMYLGIRRNHSGLALETDEVNAAFRKFYERKIGASFPHVFRMQYEIVKVIDVSTLSRRRKIRLIALYRSMLSDPMLHLLLYWGLSPYTPNDHRDLVNKYNLLGALLFKEEKFISDRIPEIEKYAAYSNWKNAQKELRKQT
jgi:hypothetical protein